MKHIKHLLALLLTFALTFGLAVPAFAADDLSDYELDNALAFEAYDAPDYTAISLPSSHFRNFMQYLSQEVDDVVMKVLLFILMGPPALVASALDPFDLWGGGLNMPIILAMNLFCPLSWLAFFSILFYPIR